MAASITTSDKARLSSLVVTFATGGDSYSSSGGGMPFDLAAICNANGINANNIVGVQPLGLTTGGRVVGAYTLGTTTTAANPPFGTQTSPAVPALTSIQSSLKYATVPIHIKLHAIGAAATQYAVLGEVADGAITDTFTAILLYKETAPTV